MKDIEISQVAKRSNLPASTLRYYEEIGLIAPSGRRGQRRIYDPDIIDRLAVITLARSAGFSLEEIGMMFCADGKPDIKRQMLTEKAQELDETIQRLTFMKKALLRAAKCPAPRHMECPKFRRLMKAAISGKLQAAKASNLP